MYERKGGEGRKGRRVNARREGRVEGMEKRDGRE